MRTRIWVYICLHQVCTLSFFDGIIHAALWTYSWRSLYSWIILTCFFDSSQVKHALYDNMNISWRNNHLKEYHHNPEFSFSTINLSYSRQIMSHWKCYFISSFQKIYLHQSIMNFYHSFRINLSLFFYVPLSFDYS